MNTLTIYEPKICKSEETYNLFWELKYINWKSKKK